MKPRQDTNLLSGPSMKRRGTKSHVMLFSIDMRNLVVACLLCVNVNLILEIFLFINHSTN